MIKTLSCGKPWHGLPRFIMADAVNRRAPLLLMTGDGARFAPKPITAIETTVSRMFHKRGRALTFAPGFENDEIMNQQVLIWSLVVAAVVVAIVLREFHNERDGKTAKHKFIEIGKESEIFFCPGDVETDERAAN